MKNKSQYKCRKCGKNMKNYSRIPLSIALLSILAYSNQGISSLPSQCLYYLTRESWHLNAATIGLISWVVGIAWYIKILWGWLADKFNNTKKSLYVCYSLMLLIYLWIIVFGLTLASLIATGLLINICIGFADTNVDKKMVIAENKFNLKGRLQAIQWTALGVGGLIVALGGAWIAKYFPEHINYKVAYAFAAILPIAMLVYLKTKYKEAKIKKIKFNFKEVFKKLGNKKLLTGLAFIACLQLCPSFGTSLMIKVREELHVDKLFLGYLGAMGTVLGIIGYIIYYKYAYKFSIKKLLYFMVIFSAITNLFYLYIPNQWYLLAYNLTFGAFGGVTFMAFLAFFVKLIPAGHEGIYYALVTSVSNFCGNGGNYIGGLIYDSYGYTINVLVSTGLTLLCLLLIPKLQIDKVQ